MGKGGHGHGGGSHGGHGGGHHFGGGGHHFGGGGHHFGGGGHHFGGGGHQFGGSHHRHHYSSGRGGGGGVSFEASMDLLHNSVIPPSLINGVYSFTGSEMSFRTQVEQPLSYLQEQGSLQQQQLNMFMLGQNVSAQQLNSNQPINPLMLQMSTPIQQNNPTQQNNTPVQQINITLVGNKTKSSNNCCFVSTIFLGACFCFPYCFMCCMWWKKIVNPMYELSVQTYRDIGSFIQRNPNANNLNLTVVDNAFNAEKAGILFDILSRSHITAFTFLNEALDCNGQHNEADDFRNNMQPIKSLTNVASSIRWGSMIV